MTAPTAAAIEAVATADAHLNNAGMPTYTELLAALEALACRASRPMGADSCGRALCRVLEANVKAGAALGAAAKPAAQAAA